MVDPVQAVWFLVLFLVLQQIEGNLIYPARGGKLRRTALIWVLVAVTVGGNMFGILGILVFIPLCSVLYALFAMFVKKRLREREIPESPLERAVRRRCGDRARRRAVLWINDKKPFGSVGGTSERLFEIV